MIRRPPRSTQSRSSAASDVYKRQAWRGSTNAVRRRRSASDQIRSGPTLPTEKPEAPFLPQVEALLGGDRRVGMLGFREFMNAGFSALAASGVEMFDLEDRVGAFTGALPRVRIIPLESFDPVRYL